MEVIAGSLEVVVRQMRLEADGVISVTLERDDSEDLPSWEPGAHIDLVLPTGLIRQYSLCGSLNDSSRWIIAILRETESKGGSQYIHEQLRPGDHLETLGPRNHFPLVQADHYLLIAGGIGVTPLIPMVNKLNEDGADWQLLYGGRRRVSMAFLKPLAALGDRVVISPEDENGLLDLQVAIESTPETTEIYCCGPNALITAVETQCSRSSRNKAHVERFSAALDRIEPTDSSAEIPFDVVIESSGQRITVPPNRSIVDVLQENHVFVVTSCTEGYCGVCETEVISGIPDHRDELPEELRSDQRMRVCISRSKTPELVLKL